MQSVEKTKENARSYTVEQFWSDLKSEFRGLKKEIKERIVDDDRVRPMVIITAGASILGTVFFSDPGTALGNFLRSEFVSENVIFGGFLVMYYGFMDTI